LKQIKKIKKFQIFSKIFSKHKNKNPLIFAATTIPPFKHKQLRIYNNNPYPPETLYNLPYDKKGKIKQIVRNLIQHLIN
jgi:hypothetical protein